MSAQPNPADKSAEVREELRLLRDSAADFAKGSTDHKRTRALRNALPGHDPKLIAAMGELGWFGILVPESRGGLGLGFAAMAAVLTELGRGLLGEPLIANVVLAARALELGDNEALKAKLLPAIADGAARIALAWQEESGAIDPAIATTSAVLAAGASRLSGRKRFIAGSASAAGFLITARSEQGVGLYWVERDAAGLSLEHEWRADGTPSGRLTLYDVQAEAVAARPGLAAAALARALDEAAVMIAAELFGVLSETLARTLDYLKTRVQFDKPIGSFQSLQHQAVDLFILQEVCESVLGDALRALDDPETPPLERARIASRAKARLSEGALRVTREALQLHGAIAITDDCDIGLYFKRAIALSAWLGNADAHRRRFIALGGAKAR